MMKHLRGLAALPLLGFSSCNFPLPMTVVSIRPMYGWMDGCTAVELGGHGFDDDAVAYLDGQALQDVTFPDAETNPLDVGYEMYGVTPPKTDGIPTFVNLTVESGGDQSVSTGAFYYVACPASPYPEAIAADPEVTQGSVVVFSGCNLDASLYTVRVGESDSVPLASQCGTAQVTFAAPQRDAGTWFVGFFDTAGTQVYPDPACDITVPVEAYVPPVDPDTSDTAAPYDPCGGAFTLTYGGAA
jgi:hypothetical protein